MNVERALRSIDSRLVEEADNPRCYGHRSTWPWKGYQCNAAATMTGSDGKTYCANHCPRAAKEES